MTPRRSRSSSSDRSGRVLRVVPPLPDDAPPPAATVPEPPCDCALCAGGPPGDPRAVAEQLALRLADLPDDADPLDAAMVGSALAQVDRAAADIGASPTAALVPFIAERGDSAALALLATLAAVVPGAGGDAAAAAADRLAAAGVVPPAWAVALGQPVTATGCVRLADPTGEVVAVGGAVRQGSRSYGLVVGVGCECGAAEDILLVEAHELPDVVASLAAAALEHGGIDLREEPLSAADFRWEVAKALDFRDAHDAEEVEDLQDIEDVPVGRSPDDGLSDDGFSDTGPPDYDMLAPVVRAWLRRLPRPDRPPARPDEAPAGPRPVETDEVLDLLASMGVNGRFDPSALAGLPPARPPARKLPPRRKKSDGPAPTYVVKVALRGAKPPIWRRLEVPADITLPRLHRALQVAFDWYDSHLHVFETPYGDFGAPDPELGHRSAARVTLEQVAPAVGDKITYLYDFGDGWEHVITVEKALDPPAGAATGRPRPVRCTGGRRAAPPEDCGGVWGYADLLAVLADPTHPEHAERVEWLGLDTAADFDPAAFDPDEINAALA